MGLLSLYFRWRRLLGNDGGSRYKARDPTSKCEHNHKLLACLILRIWPRHPPTCTGLPSMERVVHPVPLSTLWPITVTCMSLSPILFKAMSNLHAIPDLSPDAISPSPNATTLYAPSTTSPSPSPSSSSSLPSSAAATVSGSISSPCQNTISSNTTHPSSIATPLPPNAWHP